MWHQFLTEDLDRTAGSDLIFRAVQWLQSFQWLPFLKEEWHLAAFLKKKILKNVNNTEQKTDSGEASTLKPAFISVNNSWDTHP